MSTCLSWPIVPETFDGIPSLAEKVRLAQSEGHHGRFALLESGKRHRLKVECVRSGFFIKVEFSGTAQNNMVLTSADIRSQDEAKPLWITVRKGRNQNGRVGVAFDQQRGYMVGFGRDGEAETLMLPFSPASLNELNPATRKAYCISGCSLAGWAVTLLVALLRFGDEGVREALVVLDDLRMETEHQLDRIMRLHNLVAGDGTTKVKLSQGHSSRF